MIKKYFKVWLKMTIKSFQIALLSRFGALLFIIAKFLRFIFFLIFLIIIATKTNIISDYSIWQITFFFAIYNLVDTVPQFLLREVYRFRSYVVSGEFDYFLTKPISPLFRALFGGADILDLPLILISIGFIIFAATKIGSVDLVNIVLFFILIINAFLIALAFHIAVLSVGVLTTEVDNTIMLYRDLTQMARIPVDIYRQPLSWVLTFVIPIGIMITFPAKALMGLLSWPFIIASFLIGLSLLLLSLKFWEFALKSYSSVSS